MVEVVSTTYADIIKEFITVSICTLICTLEGPGADLPEVLNNRSQLTTDRLFD